VKISRSPTAPLEATGDALTHILDAVRGENDAALLRREREHAGSMEGVVHTALRLFRA
jgi:hypothetical protein